MVLLYKIEQFAVFGSSYRYEDIQFGTDMIIRDKHKRKFNTLKFLTCFGSVPSSHDENREK